MEVRDIRTFDISTLLTCYLTFNLLQANADEDADDASRYIGDPFHDHMSRYQLLTSMIKTNGDSNDVAKVMDKTIEALTKKRVSKMKRSAVGTGRTVTFPELDTRRSSDKRLKPSQSPEKKASAKKTLKC